MRKKKEHKEHVPAENKVVETPEETIEEVIVSEESLETGEEARVEPINSEPMMQDGPLWTGSLQFEELSPVMAFGLRREPLRMAATRVGSKPCTLVVHPDALDYAEQVAQEVSFVTKVKVSDRLELESWFVAKGQNAIGSVGK